MNGQTGKKFRLNGRSFFLTYPQCPETKEDLAAFLRCLGTTEKLVVAREKHESGEPHLHAYVKYEKVINTTRTGYFDFNGHHGNYQTCKNYHAVTKYILKDGDYLEEGINTRQYEDATKSHKKIIGKQLLDGTMTLREATIANPELLWDYDKLKKNLGLFKLDEPKTQNPKRECLWIYGAPGIGKSCWTHRNFPDAFIKQQNKWWDGYTGQEVVILEDMDTNALGHYLKIWGDNYKCTGEIKGGTVPLNHTKMIVTSNYKISQLWRDDKVMAEAIARRFVSKTVTGTYEDGYELAEIPGYLEY